MVNANGLGTVKSDIYGRGYQLEDVEISVENPDGLFTTATTTLTSTTATTTTTNTVLHQLNRDLEDLKTKLGDNTLAGLDVQKLIGSVETLETVFESEVIARKAADAKVAALEKQVGGLLPLADRLAALEASFKSKHTLPVAIQNEIAGMTAGNPEQCSSNTNCGPEVSSGTDGADLELTAKSGKVLISSQQCGSTDMCTLVRAVQAMLNKYD